MSISKLNLYCQKTKKIVPYFEVFEKEGLDHEPKFSLCCIFEDVRTRGDGKTLKKAKEDAATKMVEILKIDEELKKLSEQPHFSVESFNVPVEEIWEKFDSREFTLTLKKRVGENIELKNFKVTITE